MTEKPNVKELQRLTVDILDKAESIPRFDRRNAILLCGVINEQRVTNELLKEVIEVVRKLKGSA